MRTRPPLEIIDGAYAGRLWLHIGLVLWFLVSIGSCVDAYAVDGPGVPMHSTAKGVVEVGCGIPDDISFPVTERIVTKHIGTAVMLHLWVQGELDPAILMDYVSRHEPALLKRIGNLMQSCLEVGAGAQV